MPDKHDENVEPEPENPAPSSAARKDEARGDEALDPNDVVPVPVAMEPAEIDERAQVVEALRARREEPSRDDDSGVR